MVTGRSILGGGVAAALLGGLAWVMATSDGPWDKSSQSGDGVQPRVEQGIVVGMDRVDLPRPDWIVKIAEIGIRPDERREGLTINHRVLVLRNVSKVERVLPGSSTLIYTPHPELEKAVNQVLMGDVPVKPGFEAMFAIGRLVEVRIVQLDGQGKVKRIEDARVSFVSVTRPSDPAEAR